MNLTISQSYVIFVSFGSIFHCKIISCLKFRLLQLFGCPFISSPLNRRLIGELIVYSCSGVRPSVRRTSSSTVSNIFFSETACRTKAKFYVEPPWVGGTKVCSRHLDHMTKMAATPIYGKTLQKYSSPEPAGRFSRNLVCSIGDSSPS